jgi:hypothetical protein
MTNVSKAIFGAAALVAALASAAPAYADCRGFVCGLVQGIPVIGPAAQGIDQGVAGIKDRSSDASVFNQATSLNGLGFNNPIGSPAQVGPAPNQVIMGNRCVTYRGWVFGPYNPVGSPCHVDGPWGSDPGTVMQ